MIDLAMILVLSGHLIAANVASAAPVACLFWQRTAARDDCEFSRSLAVRLALLSMAALGVAILLGLAALGLVRVSHWGSFSAAAARIPESRYWFGIVELLFFYACMIVYIRALRRPLTRARRCAATIAALAAASDLLYHFPPLFAVITSLSLAPTADQGPVRFAPLMLRPDVLAMVAHFTLASFTAAGLAAAWLARRMASEETAAAADRAALAGARIALGATLMQMVVGFALLAYQPAPLRERMIGVDLLASGCFVAGLGAAVWLLHRLAAQSFAPATRRELTTTFSVFALAVCLMVAAQHVARQPFYGRAGGPRAAEHSGPNLHPLDHSTHAH